VRMIFVSLPVRDLSASRAFYGALGFSFNEYSSDEHSVAVVVDDNIVVVLQDRERFAELVAGEVGDPAATTTVVTCVTATSREEVDELADKALAAGGRPWRPGHGDEDAYSKSFTDPDGNAWQIMWMEPRHVID
jgi:predicted lactoylglutathione lyase